jgi:hypothetical protein
MYASLYYGMKCSHYYIFICENLSKWKIQQSQANPTKGKNLKKMQCYILGFARFVGHNLIPLPFLVMVTSPPKHAKPLS